MADDQLDVNANPNQDRSEISHSKISRIIEDQSIKEAEALLINPDSASHLFEKKPDEDYVRESTESLRQPFLFREGADKLSVLVFRLGVEWLALPTIYLKEVTQRRVVHSIPHRASPILKGIVNLNGELKLYVSLHELLQIDLPKEQEKGRLAYQRNRMMAIAKDGELWVFPVDEIDGIYYGDVLKIENVPVNVIKSSVNFIKGIIKLRNKGIGLLDDELLFTSLKRSIQ